MSGTNRKVFTQEQIDEIKELRNAGYSYDNISFMMHVSKQRIKKYCIEVLGDEPSVKKDYVPEIEPCEVPLPKFSNPACKGQDPSMWFVILPRDAKAQQRKEAHLNSQKALVICSSCDNQLECLEYAIKAEPFGIWGGTTEAERMYIRKMLNIKCARDGGIGQALRGLTRPMMNALMRDPSEISHLFKNPIVVNYIGAAKK